MTPPRVRGFSLWPEVVATDGQVATVVANRENPDGTGLREPGRRLARRLLRVLCRPIRACRTRATPHGPTTMPYQHVLNPVGYVPGFYWREEGSADWIGPFSNPEEMDQDAVASGYASRYEG